MSVQETSPGRNTAADEAMAALEPIFTGQRPTEITMPSGGTLHAGASPDTVRVESHQDPNPENHTKFLATCRAKLGRVVMKASIRVKDSSGRRNPDLHASHLLRRSLEHFDATNAKPVDTFVATWASDQNARYHSDNHAVYTRALAEDPESGPAAQGRAARQTWTGGQMAKLGFTQITSIKTQKDGSVLATFKRPSVMSGPRSLIHRWRSRKYES